MTDKELLESIATLLASRAGSPPLYEVVLIHSGVGEAHDVVVDVGSNAVDEASIPAELQHTIESSGSSPRPTPS